jgi:hypothetical protein
MSAGGGRPAGGSLPRDQRAAARSVTGAVGGAGPYPVGGLVSLITENAAP